MPPQPPQGFLYRVRRDLSRLRAVKGRGRLATLVDALLFDSGFQALLAYRVGHALRRSGVPVLPAVCRRLAIALCGVDILPNADLGGGCIIAHGLGLVVGGETVVGEDSTLLHGVTLGEVRFDELACPRLGDRVTVGAGAIVLGGITIGDGAMIGAGSVVRTDVPAGCRAAGVPARVLGPVATPGGETTGGAAPGPGLSPGSSARPGPRPRPRPSGTAPPDAAEPDAIEPRADAAGADAAGADTAEAEAARPDTTTPDPPPYRAPGAP